MPPIFSALPAAPDVGGTPGESRILTLSRRTTRCLTLSRDVADGPEKQEEQHGGDNVLGDAVDNHAVGNIEAKSR